jgi:hypothetical protein
MSIENMVNNLKNGDNVKAGKDFDGIMADKLQAALDAKKVDLASTLVQRKTAEKEEG